MRSQRPNELGKGTERFFREYLPTLRGTSRHTIRKITNTSGFRFSGMHRRPQRLWLRTEAGGCCRMCVPFGMRLALEIDSD